LTRIIVPVETRNSMGDTQFPTIIYSVFNLLIFKPTLRAIKRKYLVKKIVYYDRHWLASRQNYHFEKHHAASTFYNEFVFRIFHH
jgi:hypothetical protein